MTKPNRKLGTYEIQDIGIKRNAWLVEPEAGTTLDEMMNPAYWASVARQLRPRDYVEVWPADGTWYAELRVLVVEPLAVKVYVRDHVEFGRTRSAETALPPVPEGFEIEHRGKGGWCVRRVGETEFIFKALKSRAEAVLELDRHLKALA